MITAAERDRLVRRGLWLAAGTIAWNVIEADANETLLCAWLSAALLAGLALNADVGWWWADPVAALAIAALAVKEGREAWAATAATTADAGITACRYPSRCTPTGTWARPWSRGGRGRKLAACGSSTARRTAAKTCVAA